MIDRALAVLDRVRRPAYTGENRCVPCTVLNVVVAVAASGLVALVSVEAAVVLFAVSLLAVSLRGYLVPGTPALTKRYLPASIRDRFGSHPATGPADSGEDWETLRKLEEHRANAVDTDELLAEVGVVESGADGTPERLTDEFRAAVAARIDEEVVDPVDAARIGAVFDAGPDEVSPEDRDYPAVSVGRRIRTWPSEAAQHADVAAHEVLEEWTDRWAEVPLEQRVDALAALRALRDVCPACGGALEASDETVESCCGVHEVHVLACQDCGDRLREWSTERATGRLTR